jgi:hypothetical protein
MRLSQRAVSAARWGSERGQAQAGKVIYDDIQWNDARCEYEKTNDSDCLKVQRVDYWII